MPETFRSHLLSVSEMKLQFKVTIVTIVIVFTGCLWECAEGDAGVNLFRNITGIFS